MRVLGSMNLIVLCLLIVAFVCFVLQTFGVSFPRIQLLALGLAAWVLAQLLPLLVRSSG